MKHHGIIITYPILSGGLISSSCNYCDH